MSPRHATAAAFGTIATILSLVALVARTSHAAEPFAAAGSTTVVVGFDDDSAARHLPTARLAEVTAATPVGDLPQRLVELPQADAASLAALRRLPGVAFVEPVRRTHAAALPASAAYTAQWALRNDGQNGALADADIDAERAWALAGSGSADVLVGIVDTGIGADRALTGLRRWTNPGETGADAAGRDRAANGVDDDGNGCVDDVAGCNTLTGTGAVADDNGHGTASASLLAAPWSSPVAGLAPGSSVIVTKALDARNAGTTAALAAALDYAAGAGARVVNVSVGGPRSEAVAAAIARHPRTLFVAAAGNDGGAATYPCAEPADNIVCVGASTSADELAPFSNRDATAVDLAAPGVDLPALGRDGELLLWSGTSFAAPLVSATAALAFAARPSATAAEVKAALLATAARRSGLQGATATGGRLDSYATVAAMLGVAPAPRVGQTAMLRRETVRTVRAGSGAGAGAKGGARARRARVTVGRRAVLGGPRKLRIVLRCGAGAGCGGTVALGGRGERRTSFALAPRGRRVVTVRASSAGRLRGPRASLVVRMRGADATRATVRVVRAAAR